MLQLVQLYPRHLRVIELVSEVEGAFLVTSNTHDIERLEPPPEARIERLPLATSLDIERERPRGRAAKAELAGCALELCERPGGPAPMRAAPRRNLSATAARAARPRGRSRDAHTERQRAAERAGWVPSEVACAPRGGAFPVE